MPILESKSMGVILEALVVWLETLETHTRMQATRKRKLEIFNYDIQL